MAAKRGNAQDEVAALYTAPPEQFVAERNSLAKRLGERGDRARAAQVKKLKKPSLPAWAVNRAASNEPTAARRLLKAGDGLAKAQRGAAGEGGGAGLRRAMGAHQEAVDGLMAAVSAALAEAGHDRPAVADRARETLRAVATDDELRTEFEAGRVVMDREPVGFGSAPAPKAPPKAKKPSREEVRRAKAAERVDAAATRAADQAREEVRRAEKALQTARQELEQAEAERDRAAEELRRADST